MLPFLAQAIRNSYHTGAISPSSPALARAMTRSFRHMTGPRRILEVGPGTGPFTRQILDSLRADDSFHLVEINKRFCKLLETNHLEPARNRVPNAHIKLHSMPIQDVEFAEPFDFIVCGLPFNNFPPPATRQIFRDLLALLRPGAELSYFEYAGVRALRSAIVGTTGRSKIRRIDAHGQMMRRRFGGSRQLVLANFPPAFAVRLHGA